MRKLRVSRFLLFYAAVVFSIGAWFAVNEQTTLSAVAARYVDQTLPHKKLDFQERMVRGFKARCVSVFAYPIYALADAIFLTAKAGIEYYGSKVQEEPFASACYEDSTADITLAGRSLVGFFSFPTGIISGDYVTRHFLDDYGAPNVVESGGRYYSAPGRQLYPQTVEQVQSMVRYARDNDRKVSIAGAGMSQGMHFLPIDSDDLVINLLNLNQVIVDPEAKTVSVQSGATWGHVQRAINSYGLSMQVMQASNIFSIGGSLSANCHGWDHRAGTMGMTVSRIQIIDPNGDVREFTRNDPEFRLVVGGYGLFGVIVQVELELTDNVALIDTGEEVPIEEYARYFHEKVLPDESIRMHLYRLSLNPDALLSEGVAQNYMIDPDQKPGVISDLRDEKMKGERIERVGVHSARKFPVVRGKYWKWEKQKIMQPIPTTRNAEMRAPIQAMLNHSRHDSEWLQEFFVPGEELSSFLKELGALLTKYNVALLNGSVRYVKQDANALLGYSTQGDRFAVVLCFNQPLDEREIDHTKEWVRLAIDLTLAHNGTYYLPYQHFATKRQFIQSYPAFPDFVSAKAQYDPQGVFSSRFYEHHLALIAKEKNRDHTDEEQISDLGNTYRFVFSDSEQRREFRKFLRNIFLNLDENAYYDLLDKALARTTNHQELYAYLQKHLHKAQFNPFINIWRSLKALRGQKKELQKQVAELMADTESINGYIEIGFPGRMTRPIQNTFHMTGLSTVVHMEESLGGYLQSGFPRPYDIFVPLNDYALLTDSLDRNSADLVTMFIGLHHIPEEKLDPFVKSIADVLRPGGSFILRDHDAGTCEARAIANLAHTTFNLGTGVPWDGIGNGNDESTEVRNFQGLAYWDALMAKYGLKRDESHRPMLRLGDPTRNLMVRYVKEADPIANAEAEIQDHAFKRDQLQTFMTTVEWYSVRTAQDYAQFVEHTPFYMYPYFSTIGSFWKLFGQSLSEARRYHSSWEIFTSEHFLMSAFISMFHTFEFVAKGIISVPIAYFYQSEENLEADAIRIVVYDPEGKIDQFGEVVSKSTSAPAVKALLVPRYLPFRDLMIDMAESGIEVRNIAGQKQVQVQCSAPTDKLELCSNLSGAKKIGAIPSPVNPALSLLYLNVEVDRLKLVLPELRARGVQIEYIHDF